MKSALLSLIFSSQRALDLLGAAQERKEENVVTKVHQVLLAGNYFLNLVGFKHCCT